jgi:hypothetical protein
MREFRQGQPRHGTVFVRGTVPTANLVGILPELHRAGLNVKVVAAISPQLFRLQDAEYRAVTVSDADRWDAMVITSGAFRLMDDWAAGPLVAEYSLAADWDDQWRTGGSVDEDGRGTPDGGAHPGRISGLSATADRRLACARRSRSRGPLIVSADNSRGVPALDANISILFPGKPVEEQAAAAATAGFDAIEMWWPFAEDVPPDREVERLVRAVRDAGVSLVGLNLTGGDQEAGQHGIVAIPGGGERFRDHLDVAVGIAAAGVRVLNALYANVGTTSPREPAAAARRRHHRGRGLNPVDFRATDSTPPTPSPWPTGCGSRLARRWGSSSTCTTSSARRATSSPGSRLTPPASPTSRSLTCRVACGRARGRWPSSGSCRFSEQGTRVLGLDTAHRPTTDTFAWLPPPRGAPTWPGANRSHQMRSTAVLSKPPHAALHPIMA